jgi:hypothetical protein
MIIWWCWSAAPIVLKECHCAKKNILYPVSIKTYKHVKGLIFNREESFLNDRNICAMFMHPGAT